MNNAHFEFNESSGDTGFIRFMFAGSSVLVTMYVEEGDYGAGVSTIIAKRDLIDMRNTLTKMINKDNDVKDAE